MMVRSSTGRRRTVNTIFNKVIFVVVHVRAGIMTATVIVWGT